jgi:hypothetical protein
MSTRFISAKRIGDCRPREWGSLMRTLCQVLGGEILGWRRIMNSHENELGICSSVSRKSTRL